MTEPRDQDKEEKYRFGEPYRLSTYVIKTHAYIHHASDLVQ